MLNGKISLSQSEPSRVGLSPRHHSSATTRLGAAAGAVVGAAIAIPAPIIGPVFGAAVGATIGAYKHLTENKTFSGPTSPKPQDTHAELMKFHDLREKSILTEEEFQREKTRILGN